MTRRSSRGASILFAGSGSAATDGLFRSCGGSGAVAWAAGGVRWYRRIVRCRRTPRGVAGEGGTGGDEGGGCPLDDDPAAVVAGAGAEVDDPVGMRHDRLVVLDDDDRLAGVDEPVEQAEQLLDVGEVEAGGRLVEDVDVALLGHIGSQLEPLPLAAGQRSERLAEAEVAEPDVREPVEDGTCTSAVGITLPGQRLTRTCRPSSAPHLRSAACARSRCLRRSGQGWRARLWEGCWAW